VITSVNHADMGKAKRSIATPHFRTPAASHGDDDRVQGCEGGVSFMSSRPAGHGSAPSPQCSSAADLV